MREQTPLGKRVALFRFVTNDCSDQPMLVSRPNMLQATCGLDFFFLIYNLSVLQSFSIFAVIYSVKKKLHSSFDMYILGL